MKRYAIIGFAWTGLTASLSGMSIVVARAGITPEMALPIPDDLVIAGTFAAMIGCVCMYAAILLKMLNR